MPAQLEHYHCRKYQQDIYTLFVKFRMTMISVQELAHGLILFWMLCHIGDKKSPSHKLHDLEIYGSDILHLERITGDDILIVRLYVHSLVKQLHCKCVYNCIIIILGTHNQGLYDYWRWNIKTQPECNHVQNSTLHNKMYCITIMKGKVIHIITQEFVWVSEKGIHTDLQTSKHYVCNLKAMHIIYIPMRISSVYMI